MPRHDPEIYKARCALIDEQIAAGLTSSSKIADKLKDTEPFQEMIYTSLVTLCWYYLRDKGIASGKKQILEKRRALIDEQINAGLTSPVKIADKLRNIKPFNGISYNIIRNLCWKQLKERDVKVQRMAKNNQASNKANLATTFESSSELKRKIADLESQLADLRGHKCSDAENELKNENQELRTKVRQLEGRIEILSRGTRPSVVARPGFGG